MNYITMTNTTGDFVMPSCKMIIQDEKMEAAKEFLQGWRERGGVIKISKEQPADWFEEEECDDKQKCDECGKVVEDDGLDLCNACDKAMSMCSGDGHKCEYFDKDEMWRAGNYHYCSRECVQEYLDECLSEGKHPELVHRPKVGDEDCENCDDFLAIIHPADE